jgi:hypothetical protein
MSQNVLTGNEEYIKIKLQDLYNGADIVSEIKGRRLIWLGHIERMRDSRLVKKVYRENPGGRRLRACSRKRFLEEVEDDPRQMGIRGWRQKATNRDEWNGILQEAKDLHGL